MRAIRASIAAAAVALVLIVAVASPAAAHDELISSSPTNGQRMPEAPTSVSLSFSASVLTIGAAVIVADQSGKDWVIGDPEVDAGTVTVALAPGMPDAGYEVRWRVVSSDGHPVSGLVPFTVGDGSPLSHDSASGSSPAATATGAEASPPAPSIPRRILVGLIGAVLAAALFAGILFITRRRPRGNTETPRSDPAERDTL